MNTPNLFVQQGWQCPLCHRVYSPMTPMCFYCPPKTDTNTNEQQKEKVKRPFYMGGNPDNL